MEINKKGNKLVIKINSKIYSLDVIYTVCYVFLEKAYIRIDGDPNEIILIELTSKPGFDIDLLEKEFQNELINYAFHEQQLEKTKDIRTIMLQKALLGSGPTIDSNLKKAEIKEDFTIDPESVPWEE
jgi:His-Xaa-Ser system protein HxsD